MCSGLILHACKFEVNLENVRPSSHLCPSSTSRKNSYQNNRFARIPIGKFALCIYIANLPWLLSEMHKYELQYEWPEITYDCNATPIRNGLLKVYFLGVKPCTRLAEILLLRMVKDESLISFWKIYKYSDSNRSRTKPVVPEGRSPLSQIWLPQTADLARLLMFVRMNSWFFDDCPRAFWRLLDATDALKSCHSCKVILQLYTYCFLANQICCHQDWTWLSNRESYTSQVTKSSHIQEFSRLSKALYLFLGCRSLGKKRILWRKNRTKVPSDSQGIWHREYTKTSAEYYEEEVISTDSSPKQCFAESSCPQHHNTPL